MIEVSRRCKSHQLWPLCPPSSSQGDRGAGLQRAEGLHGDEQYLIWWTHSHVQVGPPAVSSSSRIIIRGFMNNVIVYDPSREPLSTTTVLLSSHFRHVSINMSCGYYRSSTRNGRNTGRDRFKIGRVVEAESWWFVFYLRYCTQSTAGATAWRAVKYTFSKWPKTTKLTDGSMISPPIVGRSESGSNQPETPGVWARLNSAARLTFTGSFFLHEMSCQPLIWIWPDVDTANRETERLTNMLARTRCVIVSILAQSSAVPEDILTAVWLSTLRFVHERNREIIDE